ncbi:hypothetical protein BD413DRAFT_199748 [Trametes elegans]|nr:hypothetical protein BD413DRAFT_199748 [Trametes elegans]
MSMRRSLLLLPYASFPGPPSLPLSLAHSAHTTTPAPAPSYSLFPGLGRTCLRSAPLPGSPSAVLAIPLRPHIALPAPGVPPHLSCYRVPLLPVHSAQSSTTNTHHNHH